MKAFYLHTAAGNQSFLRVTHGPKRRQQLLPPWDFPQILHAVLLMCTFPVTSCRAPRVFGTAARLRADGCDRRHTMTLDPGSVFRLGWPVSSVIQRFHSWGSERLLQQEGQDDFPDTWKPVEWPLAGRWWSSCSLTLIQQHHHNFLLFVALLYLNKCIWTQEIMFLKTNHPEMHGQSSCDIPYPWYVSVQLSSNLLD